MAAEPEDAQQNPDVDDSSRTASTIRAFLLRGGIYINTTLADMMCGGKPA